MSKVLLTANKVMRIQAKLIITSSSIKGIIITNKMIETRTIMVGKIPEGIILITEMW